MSQSLKKILTLVFVRDNGKVLLGLKKRGFGCGLWNGFGGKVERGETIIEGAKRELLEESGVVADILNKVGLITFQFENDPVLLEVHVFQTSEYKGRPIETEEMKPQWYLENSIPFSQMWPDDKIWFPYLLKGKQFEAFFLFRGMDLILDHWIKERTFHNSSNENLVIKE
ncbi:oxidized purine nucleoside triphosphate hydrolase-like [Physella acuta]|uniref:oxidized purine nucleoside triphosphate hydrolase-like n=1 Tax=Physella acuta TaxID=109671 RepID=UPI0027DD365A|nr:oxidized purine nucleoside triphosphate hydrolase-like [Physella acuta]XP_059177279.1 oxidized purine nucleoside triphosphate hydrolase-like [Physella acuta]XP_059177280.1 oxidized purine nucleoside triphosphate hydrolase-like [Physella acuta]XP_059177281.1 oxidized purine nucleoside triphosphate hydrolase-like [Physella acuta]XP_059177282.1 oxidized purine nucleoside triphosphate hydrolase-like [Physella acuta]